MVVLLATIPLMLIGIAIATVPILVSMIREERQRSAEALATEAYAFLEQERLPQAA